MQSRDEGRHFLRACQIARGQFVSQSDPRTGQAGGILPRIESDFVRDKMSTDFLRREDRLRTIRARLADLDRASERQAPLSEQKFAAFPGTTIYPPALYLPQAAGIRMAALFSKKVYVLFYFARILNAVTAVFLIFLALYLAVSHQYLLLLPAVLPMSVYQFSSVSSDAGIIALSILFVALCIRFVDEDGIALRFGMVFSLLLLTLGKPVHLPAALLLLAANKRLGWKRTILFFSEVVAACAVSYLLWSYVVRAFFSKAAVDLPNRNPMLQLYFIAAHPPAVMHTFLRTVEHQGWQIIGDMIGLFGWRALPLPTWFYMTAFGVGAAVLGSLFLNRSALQRPYLIWGSSACFGVLIAVSFAAYVLWTAPGSLEITAIQGRYLIPALSFFLFVAPPLSRFHMPSRVLVCVMSVGFAILAEFWTVRITDHYYFPRSEVLRQNIHNLYNLVPIRSCPASIGYVVPSWFALVETGGVAADSTYRVILAEDDGTIVGESDPVLIGTPRQWRASMWVPDRVERVHSWFITGNSACAFGNVEIRPVLIPST
jgi:uncharacterized membrane protein